MWQVLIVEDDPQTREFFAASVARSAELALAASMGSVAQACDWLGRAGNAVDVLLVDLGLPDGSGLEVIRFARQRHPQCEPLVISMFGDEDHVLASIEAGALGYIHKDSTPENVADAVVQMKLGASPISPMIARRVLAKYLTLRATPAAAAAAPSTFPIPPVSMPLSAKELQVLELIARGYSYAETARLQNVSVHTVRSHIKSLYGKLAVHSKNEAVFEAARLGLLSSYAAPARH